jgi:hypothetical protein
MSNSTERPTNRPAGTARPTANVQETLMRIRPGPNANTTAEAKAQQGFFVQIRLSVAKMLRTLADKIG